MANDGTVKIGTELDESGLKNGLSGVGNMAEKGFAVLKTAAAASTAAIAAVGAASIAVGKDFETSMAKASTLFGDTQVNMQELNAGILQVSNSTGIAASELNESLYSALSAGIPVTEDMGDATAFLESSAKLAKAGFTDMDTALSATAKTLNAYGLDVSETDRIQKILIQTQNKGITTVGELGASLSQVTPTAAAFGVSFEQVGASLASMTAQGTPTAQATTQLNSLIAELGKEGTLASNNFKKLTEHIKTGGLTFAEAMADGWTLSDVLSLMDEEASATGKSMVDMFSSIEAGKGALSIFNSDYEGNLEAMATSADVVTDAYNKMSDTLETKADKIINSAKNLGIDIYNGIQEPLKGLADQGLEYIDQLSAAMSTGGVEGLIQAGGKILTDLLLGIANAIPSIVETAVSVINSITENINGNLPQILQAGGQILLALGSGILQLIPSLGELALNIITTLVTGLAGNLPQIIQQGQTLFSQFCDTIKNRLPELVQTGCGMLTNLLNGLLAEVPNILSQAASMMTQYLDAVWSSMPDIMQSGCDMILNLLDGIVANAPQILKQAQEMLTGFLDAIMSNLPAILDKGCDMILNLLQGLVKSAPKIISQIGTMLIDLLGKINSYLPDIIGKGIEIILKLLIGLVKATPDIIKGIAEIIVKLGKAFLDTDWGEIGLNIIKGIGTGIANAVGSLVDAAVEAAKSAFEAAKNFLGIHSPSRLMRDVIGKNMIAGIEVGMEDKEDSLVKTASGTTRKAVQSMQKTAAHDMVSGMKGRSYQFSDRNDYQKQNALFASADDSSASSGEKEAFIDYDQMAEATAQALKNMSIKIGTREMGRILREVRQ